MVSQKSPISITKANVLSKGHRYYYSQFKLDQLPSLYDILPGAVANSTTQKDEILAGKDRTDCVSMWISENYVDTCINLMVDTKAIMRLLSGLDLDLPWSTWSHSREANSTINNFNLASCRDDLI